MNYFFSFLSFCLFAYLLVCLFVCLFVFFLILFLLSQHFNKYRANICKHAGIGGFDCMKDFQIPTSKRFVYVLSGLVNFSKFKLVSVKDKIDNSQKLTVLLYFDSSFNNYFVFIDMMLIL